jgi:hypothetical protein
VDQLPRSRETTRRSGSNLNQYRYIYLMQMDRPTFLEQLTAVTLTSVLAGPHEASGTWGIIAKMTVVPGKRDEMIGILKESAADMPGCLSYVVAKDAADENAIWVTEVWDSMASHDASLGYTKSACTHGIQIFPHALGLVFERHVRHIMYSVERAFRIGVQWREYLIEILLLRTFGRNQFEGLALCRL